MKKTLDIDALSEEQYKELTSFLRNEIVERAFRATEELSYLKDLIESAIDWNYHNAVPSSLLAVAEEATTADDNLPSVDQEEAREEGDEFIVLKDPFMSRIFLSWLRIIKNKNLNPNQTWFGINRTSSPVLKKLNLRGFQEHLNKAQVQYFTKENKRFDFRKKYAKLIPEFVAHGYTCGVHTWNTKDNYCDITAPGTRNFGIYPITDKLENTNKVFRYEISFNSLINTQGYRYDAEFLKTYLQPYDFGNSDSYYSDSTRKELDESQIRRGLVRVHELMIPSLYIAPKKAGDKPVIAKNVFFKVLFDAHTTPNFTAAKGEVNFGCNDFILEAYQDTETFETGELIETFNDTFPEDFPGKGPLIPFLYDQAHLNQLRQAHVRLVSSMADPPYSEEDLDGIDDEDTDTYDLLPGKVFHNKKVDILFPGEFVAAINYIIQAKKTITEDAENSQGLNRNRQGQPLPGKRSATEVEIIDSESSDAVFDVITQFDNVLRSSMGTRIRRSQEECKNILEAEGLSIESMGPMLNEEGELQIPDAAIIDQYLMDNEFFQRIIEWSGLEETYEHYYDQYQRELDEENEIKFNMQKAAKDLDMIERQILAPSQAATPEQAAMEQEQEQMLLAQREELKQQILTGQKSLRNLEPIPAPSNTLYFILWTDSISKSDIDVVAGTAASRLREEKETYDILLNYLQSVPEMRAITDFEKITDHLAQILKKDKSDFLKSPAERVKVEEELKAIRSQVLQQMVMEQEQAQQGK